MKRPPGKIALVDYGAGNLRSVENALRHVGAEVVVPHAPAAVRAADRVVVPGQHSPWLLALIVLWPILLLLLLHLVAGDRRPLTLWLAGLWSGLLLVSEVFFVDDIYGGKFNRFNTTLKWWPWIWTG